MEKVPLRDFQRNAKEYIKDLPVELTVRGESVVIVCSIEDYYKPQEEIGLPVVGVGVLEPVLEKDSSMEWKTCSLCGVRNETVHIVEYLQGYERTKDLMCDNCEKKIPEEMKIKGGWINRGAFIPEIQENLNSGFNLVPKPVKKKKKSR